MPNVVAAKVVDAVVQAYYPAAVDQTSTARARAQSGYTIAAAVAAAIVTAGLIGNLDDEKVGVQVAAFATLVAWLVGALLFLWAVAGGTPPIGSDKAGNPDEFVVAVIEHARLQASEIEGRLRYSLFATIAAVILTVGTLVTAFATSPKPDTAHGTLSLTKAGIVAVGAICGGAPGTVAATLDPGVLANPVVKITIDARECGKSATTMRLAKGTIAAFKSD